MKKELRRDPNNKIIAGVCSGIAKYLVIGTLKTLMSELDTLYKK